MNKKNLQLIGSLTPQENLSLFSIHKGSLTPPGWLKKRLAFLLPAPQSADIIHKTSLLRPLFQDPFEALAQQAAALEKEKDPSAFPSLLSPLTQQVHLLSASCKGLQSQIQRFHTLPKGRHALGKLILEICQNTLLYIDRPPVTAALSRAAAATDSSPSLSSLQKLCRCWQTLLVQCEQLRKHKALPKKLTPSLSQVEQALQEIWKRSHGLLFEAPLSPTPLPLLLPQEHKERTAQALLELSETLTPILAIQSLISSPTLPPLQVEEKHYTLPPSPTLLEYQAFCATLLAHLNPSTLLKADPTQVEASGRSLGKLCLKASQLKNTPQANEELTDYPAPQCLNQLFQLLQPLAFPMKSLLPSKLLLKKASHPAETFLSPPALAKLYLKGSHLTVTRKQDFFVNNFEGTPLAYLSLEADFWKTSETPWNCIAVRLSYIRFSKSISPAQKSSILKEIGFSPQEP